MLRSEVGKQLENLRADGKIGSSLDAAVVLYCDDNWREGLSRIADELHFVFITSTANIERLADAPEDAVVTGIDGITLTASAVDAEKCVRCWHRRDDVGSSQAHPELCARCIENVDGVGEERRFA